MAGDAATVQLYSTPDEGDDKVILVNVLLQIVAEGGEAVKVVGGANVIVCVAV